MRRAFLVAPTALSFFAALKASAAPTSEVSHMLVSAPGLIRQRQDVPDDPLAGLPSGDDDHPRGKNGSKGVRSCRFTANPANPRDIGDLRAALAFVQRGPKSWPCPSRPDRGAINLRIAVDGDGKITAVDATDGDNSIATALAKKLLGQAIAPRPEGPTQGTVGLTLAAGKK